MIWHLSRVGGGKRRRHAGIWGKSVPNTWNCLFKDSEAGMRLSHASKNKEALKQSERERG